jgi:phage anti-repressor protein
MSSQIANADHEERKILDNIKCDDVIKVALVKHNYNEPTMMQLAEHFGFSDEELKMLTIFWEPAFNKSWIYLSPSMITNDMGYSKVSDFYKDTMRVHYKNDVDYIEVDSTNPIVEAYVKYEQNCKCGLIRTYNIPHKRGTKQKYYLVTGSALKKMLMKAKTSKGDAICDYYIKVEELAMHMRDYISAMHLYISAKHMESQQLLIDNSAKHIAEQQLVITNSKQQINEMRIINERVQLHINNTTTLGKTSTFYIATSKIYAAQNIFKPGCIDNIGDKHLKSRLAQYNTGKTGDDLFFFCHVEEVHAAKELDYKLKKLLQQLKYNCKKEMVVVHYNSLIKIVRHVSANHTEDYEYFNTFIESGEYKLSLNAAPIIPQPILFGTHTITITEQKDGDEIKSKVIDIANLTDAEKRQYLIQAIEIFCTNNGTDYNHDEEKNSDKKIVVVWKELQTILKGICHTAKLQPSKWRNPLKSIGDDSKSIQQIKWLNRNTAPLAIMPPTTV